MKKRSVILTVFAISITMISCSSGISLKEKTEDYMNTKSAFSVYMNNIAKPQGSDMAMELIDWNDTPIDTITKFDIYSQVYSVIFLYGGSNTHFAEKVCNEMLAKDRYDELYYVYQFVESVSYNNGWNTKQTKYTCYSFVDAKTKEVVLVDENADNSKSYDSDYLPMLPLFQEFLKENKSDSH